MQRGKPMGRAEELFEEWLGLVEVVGPGIAQRRDPKTMTDTLPVWKKIWLAAWEASRKEIQALVDQQAEDDGLWFIAKTAPEAYLQEQLRLLHRVIEECYQPNQ